MYYRPEDCPAYLDTQCTGSSDPRAFAPCRVVSVDPDGRLTIELTRDHENRKRGERLKAQEWNVVPKPCMRKRKGGRMYPQGRWYWVS